jgi:hypothetical protein
LFRHGLPPTIGGVEEPRDPVIIVRRNYLADRGEIRWARSATKHRISRERSIHVIQHWVARDTQAGPPGRGPRQVLLGEDPHGVALEVAVVVLDDGGMLVIHAMPMRDQFRKRYEEAKSGEESD